MNKNTQQSVVTITLNPAIDLTAYVSELRYGSVNIGKQQGMQAGGKGINVAKVLSGLGAKVTVTGFLGQENELIFTKLFADMAIEDAFIRVQGATRTNVKLVDATQTVTDINLTGLEINQQAIASLSKKLDELAQQHDCFIFAGSLPSGISPEQLHQWIQSLTTKGKQVYLDTSGQALVHGVRAMPHFIKPNEDELAVLTATSLQSTTAIEQAALALAQTGIAHVVVSLGSNGLIWVRGKQVWHAKPPQVPVVSTVGAGDTLVAGFCWGLMRQMDAVALLRFATALSALSVQEVGVVQMKADLLHALQDQIEVKEIK